MNYKSKKVLRCSPVCMKGMRCSRAEKPQNLCPAFVLMKINYDQVTSKNFLWRVAVLLCQLYLLSPGTADRFSFVPKHSSSRRFRPAPAWADAGSRKSLEVFVDDSTMAIL